MKQKALVELEDEKVNKKGGKGDTRARSLVISAVFLSSREWRTLTVAIRVGQVEDNAGFLGGKLTGHSLLQLRPGDTRLYN